MRFGRRVGVLALVAAFALTGCQMPELLAEGGEPSGASLPQPATTPTASSDGSADASASATPTEVGTPSPTPTASPTPTPTPTPTPKPTPTAKPKPTLVPGPAIWKRGDSGRDVRELQARLKQIRWFNAGVTGNYGAVTQTAVSGFQRKRGFPETGEVDQRTWDRLKSMSREPTKNELYNIVPAATGNAKNLDKRCQVGRVLCISKSNRTLYWVIDGQVRSTLAVRFGSQFTPTREGTFSIYWKNRDHVSSLYDSEMPFAMFFSGGQAVHYSPDFAARGYNGASHGCVNTRAYAATAALFDSVQIGDKVVVY